MEWFLFDNGLRHERVNNTINYIVQPPSQMEIINKIGISIITTPIIILTNDNQFSFPKLTK